MTSLEIASIVLSGVIVPIVGLLIYFIKAWYNQKQYKRTIAEWANKAVGSMKAMKNILDSDAVKMQPPMKKDFVKTLSELLKEEEKNRKEI